MTTTGPRVVAIGGGHGLAASLRAVRQYAADLTAVVSLADDGGSSGRLRDELGIAPPGDLRKCLVALARPGSALASAFEYRLDADDFEGHALGNLVIAALVSSLGDLQRALDEAAQLLGCVGNVVPASAVPVTLKADAESGEVEGQTAVMRTEHIKRVSVVPEDPPASPAAVAAIEAADQLVVGPGSLFTSVLAALVIPGISEAVRGSAASKVYVANLRPQNAETLGFDVASHVGALQAHGVTIDTVLADTTYIDLGDVGVPVVVRDLAGVNGRVHHQDKLAAALRSLVG